ncbi:hypothetical protein CVT24_003170 [Panaeolus cyanescens]|uniref:F-box domain-containing protein n=1 Tax=Panaeolus cyanescens TaxID=181874 RepID=A0A409VNU1_9AGAR|nr:hypothetical protein CVT24_003170 [Panaeolus cyanescens]
MTMSNLQVLYLGDASFSNTWVFDFPTPPFLLRHLDIRFSWDNNIAAFIDTQTQLRAIHVSDSGDDSINAFLNPDSVPELRSFDGSMTVAMQLVQRPKAINRLQLYVDSAPDTPLNQITHFRCLSKSLRSISFVDLPEQLSLPMLGLVTEFFPNLLHLGIFPYNYSKKHEYHRYLMRLNSLLSIEIDVTTWSHLYNFLGGQRALAAEFRTFCTSIIFVCFHFGNARVIWRWNNTQSQWHRMDIHAGNPCNNLWLHI